MITFGFWRIVLLTVGAAVVVPVRPSHYPAVEPVGPSRQVDLRTPSSALRRWAVGGLSDQGQQGTVAVGPGGAAASRALASIAPDNVAATAATSTIAAPVLFVVHGLPRTSGLVPWHRHDSVTVSDIVTIQVDMSDGHVDVQTADMDIPGRGLDLVVQRTWDSTLAQVRRSTAAGQGWVSSLTPQISGLLTGTLLYTDETGAVWPFPSAGAVTGGVATYVAPPGLPWQLTASTAGYTLTDPQSGAVRAFDAQGRYLSDSDAYGNRNTLRYHGGLPTAETNSGGRALRLSYRHGLLSAVASPAWVSSGGRQGEQVVYRYNRTAQLTALTRAAGTPDALTTRFGYRGVLLVSITTPDASRWRLDYDAKGRLSRLVAPAGAASS